VDRVDVIKPATTQATATSFQTTWDKNKQQFINTPSIMVITLWPGAKGRSVLARLSEQQAESTVQVKL
jgi:hypothetical protein